MGDIEISYRRVIYAPPPVVIFQYNKCPLCEMHSPNAKKKLNFLFHFWVTQFVVLKKQNIPQDAA